MGLFTQEREIIKASLTVSRIAHYATSAIALFMPIASLVFPYQPVNAKLIEMGFGAFGGFASAYMAKGRERNVKIDETFENAAVGSLRQDTSIAIQEDTKNREIDAEMRLAARVMAMPVWMRDRYVAKYNLQGLMPPEPVQIPVNAPINQPAYAGSADVAEGDADVHDTFVNPQQEAVLKNFAARYPGLIRLDDQWVNELIVDSTQRDMGKRSNHHFYLCGETQSGKSTLAGVIISGIAARSEGLPTVAGHDPKKTPTGVDITRWLCKFTYKIDGLENSDRWLDLANKVANDQTAIVSKVGGSCAGVPEMVLMQDEVDTIYGSSKGFGDMVSADLAVKLQTFWSYGVKYQAGLRGHMVFMGQSPLSGDTGFKRPTMKNLCFIAMGQTSSYILNNPKDFLNNSNDGTLDVFRQACETFEALGLRYALVRPTRGSAYVAIIPRFNVDAPEVSVTDTPVASTPPTTPRKEKAQPKTKPGEDPIARMEFWSKACLEKLGRYPTDEEVLEVWLELTGKPLNEGALLLLTNKIRNENVCSECHTENDAKSNKCKECGSFLG